MSKYDDLEASLAAATARIAELEQKLALAQPPAYVPQRYPSYRYHADGRVVIVATPDASDALGPEWGEVPPTAQAAVFPSYRYRYGARMLVQSQADVDALGEGWTTAA